MNFRLTYATDKDTIVTVELSAPSVQDIAGAYDEAFSYLSEELGSQKVLELQAMSVLLLPGDVSNVRNN